MITGTMHRLGLRGWHFHLAALASVALCIALWLRAKTVDQAERGNAERRALFAGLWPPTLWGMGTALERRERGRRAMALRPRAAPRPRSRRAWGRPGRVA